ncbi:GNAT family N-acetyltransferase [Streptomyces kasugaensis]|uniref:GNAT family N-acetyltransferase n=1 Tax=Streptomyces kasugaensis TaxID=1946 RepID=A0A4Q9HX52_STRKA|nr:GNAT family N-acetyltransferase [Streptomyces kasugaensis]TBO59797.1 GNAT family N-acetyltransferase [Streptomyces kasugaensis]
MSEAVFGSAAAGPAQLAPLSERISAPRELPLPTAGADLHWRTAGHADIPILHELMRAAGAVDHPTSSITRQEIELAFNAPNFTPDRDMVLALDPSGRAVAYGAATLDEVRETLVQVSLDGCVHPQRRGEGIGTALLAWQEARGRQHLAACEEKLPGWLVSGAEESATSTIHLLHAHGYETARWWLELDRDLADPIPEIPLDPAVRLESYGQRWTEPARLACNAAFRDHWGSQPSTAREWAEGETLEDFRPDLSLVAVAPDADGVDQVVALVTSSVYKEDWEAQGYSFGYVGTVGVRPEWRGRGLAPALLTRVLHAYRDAGFDKALLEVDSESLTGAVGLYERLGFRTVRRSVSLIKSF